MLPGVNTVPHVDEDMDTVSAYDSDGSRLEDDRPIKRRKQRQSTTIPRRRGDSVDYGDIHNHSPPPFHDADLIQSQWMIDEEQVDRALLLAGVSHSPAGNWGTRLDQRIDGFQASGRAWHSAVLLRARWLLNMVRFNAEMVNRVARKLGISPDALFNSFERNKSRRKRSNAESTRDTTAFLQAVYRGRGAQWNTDREGLKWPPLSSWPPQINPADRYDATGAFRRSCGEMLQRNGIRLPARHEDRPCPPPAQQVATKPTRERLAAPIPDQFKQPVVQRRGFWRFNLPDSDTAASTGLVDTEHTQVITLTAYQRSVKLLCSPRTSANSLLVYHPVGSGKTISMIAVLNNFVSDWTNHNDAVLESERGRLPLVFFLVPNAAIRQEFLRNVLIDPGYVGQKLRSVDKGVRRAAGSYMTTSQVKALNRMMTILSYGEAARQFGFTDKGGRVPVKLKMPRFMDRERKNPDFNVLDGCCLIMDEAHTLLSNDSTRGGNKSKAHNPSAAIRHAIDDAQDLHVYGFTASPSPNHPIEIVKLLNHMRCRTLHRLALHKDRDGTGIPQSLLKQASGLISYYSTSWDTKRFPRHEVTVLPVPISAAQYAKMKPWYNVFYGGSGGHWAHEKLPNPFSAASLFNPTSRTAPENRVVDVTHQSEVMQKRYQDPSDLYNGVATGDGDTSADGYAAPSASGATPIVKGDDSAEMSLLRLLNANAHARRLEEKAKPKPNPKTTAKANTKGRQRSTSDTDDDDDDAHSTDSFVDDDELEQKAHPIWGVGSVLATWTAARKQTYALGSTWHNLAKPGRLLEFMQNSWEYAPKFEFLVSRLAHSTAFGDKQFLGKHLVFTSFAGPGLSALTNFLKGIGFRHITSIEQLRRSQRQDPPDTPRFVALQNVDKAGLVLLRRFNEADNRDGAMLPVAVLNMDYFKEGVHFQDVVCAHILEPPQSNGQLQQIMGRCLRLCSHARLASDSSRIPPVSILIYCAVVGHPAYYSQDETTPENFVVEFAKHLQQAGAHSKMTQRPWRASDHFTQWPCTASTPDEVTLQAIIEQNAADIATKKLISANCVDSVISSHRR